MAEHPLPAPRGRVLDVTDEQYFADPCEGGPSLSSSIATTLLDRSPLHAWQEHPRLGGTRRKPTDSMDRGTLVHRLLLGVGADVVLIDADSYRTKAAQQERDEARAAGKLPVLAGAYGEALAVADVLGKRIADHGIDLSGGRRELAIEWPEETEHGTVTCRGRLDYLEGSLIVDLKTSRSAHPKSCSRHVIEYGYDVSRAAYTRAVEALHPEYAGAVDFVFLFVELQPPYAVAPYRLDGVLREYGERRWHRAAETWARCLSRGEWPGYGDGIEYLAAPGWLLARMEEEEL